MIRRTVWALISNLSGAYVVLPFIALFTVGAFVTDSDRAASYNLLMSYGAVAAMVVGLIAGTTLTEIKVKPLSYVLPGEERSLAPAALLVGALVCLAYALLVLGQPMTIVAVPAWQQALAAFGFSLGLFALVAAACVVTHDTTTISQITVFPFLLLVGASGDETIASAWLSLSVAVAEHAFVAVLFAAGGVTAVLHLLGDRTHSRRLCGAPFLPLKAYDNPFKLDAYRSRMKSSAFRPSVMTDGRPSPGGLAMTALSRRVVGTSWDYLVLETRAGANRWEFGIKLVSVVLTSILVGLYAYGLDARLPDMLFGLFFLVALTFWFFPPTFKARLSPMPPVSRRRHFRSFLAKGLSIYALTAVAILLFMLLTRVLSATAIESGFEALTATASLPLRAVVVVSATVPIMCWAYATLRSTIGFVLFMLAFMVTVRIVSGTAHEVLLAQSYPVLLLVTALCWLPFVRIAWKRCVKEDLLLL